MNSFSPLRIAVVGLSFGKHMLNSLQEPSAGRWFELAGVCDLRQDVAEEMGRRHQVKVYSSMEQLIADPSIAVVGLFTGPRGRAYLLDQILEAGKDVLTTKPFELDAGAAEKVLRKARRLGRVIHLNSPSPELPADLAQIVAWREKYALGRLISARGEVWASYFEKADSSWLDDPETCPGGVMMRLGIYLINDILCLTEPVEEIQFLATRVRTGRPTPDNALLSLRFRGGCLASVFASQCVDDGDPFADGLTLNYERGTIYRNVGSHRPLSIGKKSSLALVMRTDNTRRVVAEAAFEEKSGDYQWAALHRAVTLRETLDEDYIRNIVRGVEILQYLRDSVRIPAPLEESASASLTDEERSRRPLPVQNGAARHASYGL